MALAFGVRSEIVTDEKAVQRVTATLGRTLILELMALRLRMLRK